MKISSTSYTRSCACFMHFAAGIKTGTGPYQFLNPLFDLAGKQLGLALPRSGLIVPMHGSGCLWISLLT